MSHPGLVRNNLPFRWPRRSAAPRPCLDRRRADVL